MIVFRKQLSRAVLASVAACAILALAAVQVCAETRASVPDKKVQSPPTSTHTPASANGSDHSAINSASGSDQDVTKAVKTLADQVDSLRKALDLLKKPGTTSSLGRIDSKTPR